MGPTAGSSGLALIIGISEGTLGGLVGVHAFFAAADHVAVWGAPVKSMKLFGYPHFSSYDSRKPAAIIVELRTWIFNNIFEKNGAFYSFKFKWNIIKSNINSP